MKQELEELEALIDRLCERNERLLKEKDECSRKLSTIEEDTNKKVEDCLAEVRKSEGALRNVKKTLEDVSKLLSDLTKTVDDEIASLEKARTREVGAKDAPKDAHDATGAQHDGKAGGAGSILSLKPGVGGGSLYLKAANAVGGAHPVIRASAPTKPNEPAPAQADNGQAKEEGDANKASQDGQKTDGENQSQTQDEKK